jgi:hypothetical protein
MDDKYRELIRTLIMPRNWHLVRYSPETPYEDREKCLDAGIKAFDEIFTRNHVLRAAQGAAERAMEAAAKKFHEKRLKQIERTVPTIQAKILELIEGKEPGFDLGYEVAAALKALGYTWDQVILAKRDMKLPSVVDGGIQIGYTGLYD